MNLIALYFSEDSLDDAACLYGLWLQRGSYCLHCTFRECYHERSLMCNILTSVAFPTKFDSAYGGPFMGF